VIQEDTRSPWEIAFERMAFLKESGLINQEKYKEYYVELTEITRDYLGKMYELDVPEMTTEQFSVTFAEITMPEGLYGEMVASYRHADLVKFARFVPELSRTENDFLLAHRLVETLRAEYVKQQEEASQNTAPPSPVAAVESREESIKEDRA